MLDFVFPPVLVDPEPPPEPLPEQPVGYIPPSTSRMVTVFGMDYGGGMDFTNDTISKIQTCDLPIDNITGETLWDWYSRSTVHPNDFKTIKFEYYRAWLHIHENMNNTRLLYAWCQPRYGWCDNNADPTDPWVDDVHYNIIDCGLNRREAVGEVNKNGTRYCIIRMVPATSNPRAYSWEEEPHLVQLQTTINNAETWWRSPVQGKVLWPNWGVSEFMAYNLSHCAYYPDTPFSALVHGYQVTVNKLLYQGSKTFGLLSGELNGWYVLEEIVTPEGLSDPNACRTDLHYNRYVISELWPGFPTAPECPWRKS